MSHAGYYMASQTLMLCRGARVGLGPPARGPTHGCDTPCHPAARERITCDQKRELAYTMSFIGSAGLAFFTQTLVTYTGRGVPVRVALRRGVEHLVPLRDARAVSFCCHFHNERNDLRGRLAALPHPFDPLIGSGTIPARAVSTVSVR